MRIDEEEEWAERETEPHTWSLFVGPYVLIGFYSQWGHKRVSEEGGICGLITGLKDHSSNDVRDRLRQSM